jgi:gag-polypeptide of LTR copia-type
MEALIIHKDLWGAVTSDDDEAASAKARALIPLYVRDQHLSTVRGWATAKEVWTALQKVFSAKNEARRLQLKRDLISLRLDNSVTLIKYVARARDIQDRMTTAGCRHGHRQDEG